MSTTVDVNMVATDSTKPVQFESRFFSQTRDRLSEGHMWVSIVYRPTLSTFTRVQRASCALVYIFLNMIASAMYFNPDPNYVTNPLIQIGPLRFTSQQVRIIFKPVLSICLLSNRVNFTSVVFKARIRKQKQ